MTTMIIQGIILGIIIVLPGMSGGTVFLIFGIYEQVIRDIARLNLKPYLPLCLGLIFGVYLGGLAFTLFFQFYRDATAAFLLGCLLASVKPVVSCCPKPDKKGVLAMVLGIITGFVLVFESIGDFALNMDINWGLLILGGALSSAAMIIPGIPGSSILIILGIYDSMLFFIAELNVLYLSLFGIGSILGILLLANAINTFYINHRIILSYAFAGLIIGSARGLIPYNFSILYLVLFLLGFALVWFGSSKMKPRQEVSKAE
ncbi:undecaprenyl phosphate translocase family protein [Desulfitibacter alkalitolerans]|uniref:undecaprenyl phosphate translocase family protein n=1 Tax=Desulfitibacter alkalitolerans TaxID=264641 RepID=UPI001FA6D046|nr:DUF368 domain-containing protein [Desulfitibacter alkalitolerans]